MQFRRFKLRQSIGFQLFDQIMLPAPALFAMPADSQTYIAPRPAAL
jgi:hypothetical protein